MEIISLQVQNFRNYGNETVYFSPSTNILLGENAQGKTNLIEAIYFCSIGKSPRINNEKDLINYDCDNSKIICNFKAKDGNKKIILYDKNNNALLELSNESEKLMNNR